MRILHILHDISPASGGPTISGISAACAQAVALNAEVTVLCYKKDGHEETIENIKSYPGSDRLSFLVLGRDSKFEKLTGIDFYRAMHRVIKDFNLVYIHGVWTPSLMWAALFALYYKIPYIVAPHGMLDSWSMAYKKYKKALFWQLIWKRIINNALFIHALNDDEKLYMAPLEIQAPIEIIPNGIFQTQIEHIKKLNEITDQTKTEEPYLLFLSRIQYKKGLDFLINAFAIVNQKYPQLKLYIVGPDEGFKSAIEKLIVKNNLTDSVQFKGAIYGEEKFSYIRKSEIFCLTSRQEGFSIAIIEALAVGVPVVISKDCHFPEVETYGAGHVVDLEIESIANAIIDILQNKTRANEMGMNGQNMIEKYFTWEQIGKAFKEAILRHIKVKI
jgi:glycosyltransferase involved in cell wall biosynthesis